MGKISNALNKYAKERREVQGQPPPPVALNQDDINALLKHDRETRHLLRYDKDTGEVDQESIEVLRNQGTIQRLLDSKLIYPSGKLTSRGVQECKLRFKALTLDNQTPLVMRLSSVLEYNASFGYSRASKASKFR